MARSRIFTKLFQNREKISQRLLWVTVGATLGGAFNRALGYVYTKLEMEEPRYIDDIESTYREAAITAENHYEKLQCLRKAHTTAIIKMAFEDMNVRNKIILINEECEPSIMTSVQYNGNDTNILRMPNYYYKLPDDEIYAMAGHEAAHVNRHALLPYISGSLKASFALSFLNYANHLAKAATLSGGNLAVRFALRALVSYYSYCVANATVTKIIEVDADITSAKRLGTAVNLSEHLQTSDHFLHPSGGNSIEEKVERVYDFLFSAHPSTQTRTGYLSKINVATPLLFSNEKYIENRKDWNDALAQSVDKSTEFHLGESMGIISGKNKQGIVYGTKQEKFAIEVTYSSQIAGLKM
jgi:hypothetical protein